MPRPPSDPNASRPIFLDVQAQSVSHGVWEAEFTARRFSRLTDIAANDVPQLSVRLEFSRLEGHPLISGTVHGSVQMICQRCLKPMDFPLDETLAVLLVENEAELNVLPDTQDAVIANATHFDVTDLIEEQMLLALPLIPVHDSEAECDDEQHTQRPTLRVVKNDAVPPADTQRPFADLRDLLKK